MTGDPNASATDTLKGSLSTSAAAGTAVPAQDIQKAVDAHDAAIAPVYHFDPCSAHSWLQAMLILLGVAVALLSAAVPPKQTS